MTARPFTPSDVQSAILRRMADGAGGPISTHWMDHAAGCPGVTAGTRRRLQTLARHGLVEGVDGLSSGRVYWWKITDAGRAAIALLEGQSCPAQ